MKLIVGLGNPGTAYAHTRHNAGFLLADRLAEVLDAGGEKKQGQALVRAADYKSERILLVKPQTFMNLSGDALWELLHFYKEKATDFIIVHDDLDLPLGRLRFKSGGGAGGHRGLRSISQRLGSDQYDRLKLGVSRPPDLMPAEAYVLQAFSQEDKVILNQVLDCAAAGLVCWLEEGCVRAMNQFNSRDFSPQ